MAGARSNARVLVQAPHACTHAARAPTGSASSGGGGGARGGGRGLAVRGDAGVAPRGAAPPAAAVRLRQSIFGAAFGCAGALAPPPGAPSAVAHGGGGAARAARRSAARLRAHAQTGRRLRQAVSKRRVQRASGGACAASGATHSTRLQRVRSSAGSPNAALAALAHSGDAVPCICCEAAAAVAESGTPRTQNARALSSGLREEVTPARAGGSAAAADDQLFSAYPPVLFTFCADRVAPIFFRRRRGAARRATMADEAGVGAGGGDIHDSIAGKVCDLCGEACEANQELCVPSAAEPPARASARWPLPHLRARAPCAAFARSGVARMRSPLAASSAAALTSAACLCCVRRDAATCWTARSRCARWLRAATTRSVWSAT
jgi:hypothetical protein